MQAWAARKDLKLDGLNDWLKQEPDVRLQQLGVRVAGGTNPGSRVHEMADGTGATKTQEENIDLDSPEIQKEGMERMLVDQTLRVDFSEWKNPPELSVTAIAILSGATLLKDEDIATWRKTKDPLLFHAIVMAWRNFNVVNADWPIVEAETNRQQNRDVVLLIGMVTARRGDWSPLKIGARSR